MATISFAKPKDKGSYSEKEYQQHSQAFVIFLLHSQK
jgi:hypothetical protein